MTLVLLRDDDPNATTPPDRLERAYQPLLDAGFPVNFAVIPEVALDTRAPDGVRERFLDPDSPDCADDMPLLADTPLAVWLRRHEQETDVFLHGFSHRRRRGETEFGALSREESVPLIRRGLETLTNALGRTPMGFVPPWDRLSRGAVDAVFEQLDLVSTGWIDRPRLPITAWPAYVAERLGQREALRVRRGWLLRHRGGKILGTTSPDAVASLVDGMTAGADVGVIVLHHWMFWDQPEPHPVIVALAKALSRRQVVTVRQALTHLDQLPVVRLSLRRGLLGL